MMVVVRCNSKLLDADVGIIRSETNKTDDTAETQPRRYLRIKNDEIRDGWANASEQDQSVPRLDGCTQLLSKIEQSAAFNVEDA